MTVTGDAEIHHQVEMEVGMETGEHEIVTAIATEDDEAGGFRQTAHQTPTVTATATGREVVGDTPPASSSRSTGGNSHQKGKFQ